MKEDSFKANVLWMVLGAVFAAGVTIGTIRVTLSSSLREIEQVAQNMKQITQRCTSNTERIIRLETRARIDAYNYNSTNLQEEKGK